MSNDMSETIKRYHLTHYGKGFDLKSRMDECVNGEYVKYEDVKSLIEDRDLRDAEQHEIYISRKMKKHTPEPWYAQGPLSDEESCRAGGTPPNIVAESDEPGYPIHLAEFESESDRDRAIDCVNVLAGRDPTKLGKLETAIEVMTQAWEDDSPLQSHFIEELRTALAAFRKSN